ncbi:hypothetical protein EGW08_002145 [Elysia chlorotica]|uniref:Uncharacterized protein n=1 Tax=Elysia chlorotica TaxID=188477 RepID=A0A3S1BS72_ELYCH|nr:hypothetical protein EGW08_002145 [Elysia chlorotica]
MVVVFDGGSGGFGYACDGDDEDDGGDGGGGCFCDGGDGEFGEERCGSGVDVSVGDSCCDGGRHVTRRGNWSRREALELASISAEPLCLAQQAWHLTLSLTTRLAGMGSVDGGCMDAWMQWMVDGRHRARGVRSGDWKNLGGSQSVLNAVGVTLISDIADYRGYPPAFPLSDQNPPKSAGLASTILSAGSELNQTLCRAPAVANAWNCSPRFETTRTPLALEVL